MTLSLFGDDEPEPILIKVAGRPAPQGSKSAFPVWKGAPCPACERRDLAMINQVESSKYVQPWRNVVAAAGKNVMLGRKPLKGPVAVSMVFSLARPKLHFRTGLSSHRLRGDAPRYPDVYPDGSKLLRATEDALTGTAWADDAQIVEHRRVAKLYAGDPDPDALTRAGAVIRIWLMRV